MLVIVESSMNEIGCCFTLTSTAISQDSSSLCLLLVLDHLFIFLILLQINVVHVQSRSYKLSLRQLLAHHSSDCGEELNKFEDLALNCSLVLKDLLQYETNSKLLTFINLVSLNCTFTTALCPTDCTSTLGLLKHCLG